MLNAVSLKQLDFLEPRLCTVSIRSFCSAQPVSGKAPQSSRGEQSTCFSLNRKGTLALFTSACLCVCVLCHLNGVLQSQPISLGVPYQCVEYACGGHACFWEGVFGIPSCAEEGYRDTIKTRRTFGTASWLALACRVPCVVAHIL